MAWFLSLCVRSIGRFLSVATIAGWVRVVNPLSTEVLPKCARGSGLGGHPVPVNGDGIAFSLGGDAPSLEWLRVKQCAWVKCCGVILLGVDDVRYRGVIGHAFYHLSGCDAVSVSHVRSSRCLSYCARRLARRRALRSEERRVGKQCGCGLE